MLANKVALLEDADRIEELIDSARNDLDQADLNIYKLECVFKEHFEQNPDAEKDEKLELYQYVTGLNEELDGVFSGLEAISDMFSDFYRFILEMNPEALDGLYD